MLFCKTCGTYSSKKAEQCATCGGELTVSAQTSTTGSNSSVARTARLIFLSNVVLTLLLTAASIAGAGPTVVVAAILSFFGLLLTGPFLMIATKRWVSLTLGVATAIVIIALLPYLMRRPHYSNENAAIAYLRTINTAEVTYLSSSGGSYGTIPELIKAGLLDETFNSVKAGYRFSVIASGENYYAAAIPANPESPYSRYGYYSVPDAVVRYTTLAPKGQAGQPVQ